MNGDPAGWWHRLDERMDKLERRLDDLEAQALSLNETVRQIADGRVACVKEENVLSRVLLDALGLVVLFAALALGALAYLSSRPSPFPIIIPPPHSTQLPKEER